MDGPRGPLDPEPKAQATDMRHALLLGSIGLGVLAAVSSCRSPEGGAAEPAVDWSIETAEVLFTGRREGGSDLYTIDLASRVTTRLTTFAGSEEAANAGRLSPDGGRIAFQVQRGSDYEIHIMDRVTGETRNVTGNPAYDISPIWSPDGRQLAFMSTRGFELGTLGPFPGHIYLVDVESGELRVVTRDPLTSALGPSDWSPDGSTLLMARMADGGPDVFGLDVGSGEEDRLTEGGEGEYSARYSHAGDRIAFHSESESESQIVVVDLSTGVRDELTSGPGYRYYPKWSPDDQWILFTASEDGDQYDIRAVRISDRTVVELVATPEDEREGEWVWPPS